MTARFGNKEDSRIVNKLFHEEKWTEARAYILELLKEEPADHWLLTQLGETCYEERRYQKALEYTEQALKITPRCPLVLWHYAGALDMLERNEEAINVYKGLIRRGTSRIAHGQCGEGVRSARSLVNDCRYRLGLIYARTGRPVLARKYIREHIANRSRSCTSIYGLREVKQKLAAISSN